MVNSMHRGVADDIWQMLHTVFAQFACVEQVLLFGSRATGHFKAGSDIDLAIIAPKMDDTEFAKLWCAIDALPIVFKIDCLHVDRLSNLQLRQNILQDGVVIYPKPLPV